MAVTFHTQLIPDFEAFALISQLVNQTTPALLYDRLRGVGLDQEVSARLDDLLRIFKQAQEHLMPFDPKVEALFLRHSECTPPTSGAELLAYPYIPDQLHVLEERLDALTKPERQRQLFDRMNAILTEEREPPSNALSPLISMLEQSTFDSLQKYQILLLFHHTMESARWLQLALSRALWIVSGALHSFRAEVMEQIKTLRAVPDFEDYVYKKTGIQLAGKGDIHVYPSALLLDAMHIEHQMGDKPPSVSLIWGLRFNALTALNAEVKILSETRGAQLRAMSERTRLQILLSLRERPYYGGELAELLHLKPATLSHHLSELLRYELVTARPEQSRLYYTLNTAHVRETLQMMIELLQPW